MPAACQEDPEVSSLRSNKIQSFKPNFAKWNKIEQPTTKITIAGSELKAHKIPPSILTLRDDGTVGVKAVNEENIVVFFPTISVKDTIDGIWVSGLPDKVNLIVTGQEYVAVGESITN